MVINDLLKAGVELDGCSAVECVSGTGERATRFFVEMGDLPAEVLDMELLSISVGQNDEWEPTVFYTVKDSTLSLTL